MLLNVLGKVNDFVAGIPKSWALASKPVLSGSIKGVHKPYVHRCRLDATFNKASECATDMLDIVYFHPMKNV